MVVIWDRDGCRGTPCAARGRKVRNRDIHLIRPRPREHDSEDQLYVKVDTRDVVEGIQNAGKLRGALVLSKTRHRVGGTKRRYHHRPIVSPSATPRSPPRARS